MVIAILYVEVSLPAPERNRNALLTDSPNNQKKRLSSCASRELSFCSQSEKRCTQSRLNLEYLNTECWLASPEAGKMTGRTSHPFDARMPIFIIDIDIYCNHLLQIQVRQLQHADDTLLSIGVQHQLRLDFFIKLIRCEHLQLDDGLFES